MLMKRDEVELSDNSGVFVVINLIFTRHGESEANVLQEFSNQGIKHPLTMKGIQQAEKLAEELIDKNIMEVYSSPILRAFHTTEIIVTRLAIQNFIVSEKLREYNVGHLEGKSDRQSWELYHSTEEEWRQETHRQDLRKIRKHP